LLFSSEEQSEGMASTESPVAPNMGSIPQFRSRRQIHQASNA
jgi:hypothetical protein